MPKDETIKTEQYLNLVVFPHRSFKPEHFSRLLIILAVLCTFGGIRFTMVGAWPVAAFLFLDLLAIWFAFYINNRRARVHEVIELTDTDLKIKRTLPDGHTESWRFEPYWVKLSLSEDTRTTNRLEVSLHEQSVSLGTFLTPAERKSLHRKLSNALRAWKNR